MRHVVPIVIICHVLTAKASSSSNNNAAWENYYRQRDDSEYNRESASRGQQAEQRDSKADGAGDYRRDYGRYDSNFGEPQGQSQESSSRSGGTYRNWQQGGPPQQYSSSEPYSDRSSGSQGSPASSFQSRDPRNPYESRTPIHYQFQATAGPLETESKEDDDIPRTSVGDETRMRPPPHDMDDRDKTHQYASARNDAVTRYMSTKRGRMLLTLSSGTVGLAVGGFIGKSLMNQPQLFAMSFFGLFVACTFLRNPYGELSRALGLALLYALQRTTSIRRRYPAWGHVRAAFFAGRRRPFPPVDNPWNYQPELPEDVEFRMLFVVIAMGFIGSLCGGTLPILPSWMGAVIGAAFLAFLTTLRTARGDLARTMGMRVVALIEEVIGINYELELLSKLGVVAGRVMDKMLILDRQHRIKDRLVSGFQWAYDQVARTAAQAQSDMKESEDQQEDEEDLMERRREPTEGRGSNDIRSNKSSSR